MVELFDVVAVNIKTGEHRLIAEGKTAANADAIIQMAVARRGVDEEFFKAVLHGSADAVEPADMTDYEQGWLDGTRNAVSVLAGKAKELRGIGNGTADLMARIFEEQVDAIMANSRPAEPVS